MDLISLIIIISIIVKVVKKSKAAEQNKQHAQTTYRQSNSGQNSQWQQAARENIEKARRRAESLKNSKKTTYEMPKQSVRTTPAYEQVNMQDYQKSMAVSNAQKQKSVMEENDEARMQVYKSRLEAQNTTILQRARANAEEDKEDVTLRSLEESHGHSAHVSPAVHHHPEDILTDNMLGTVEDLMVKGYEGNLCFERDFVGEAMDMVARFSLGGSVANES